jgi:hypothetical protein
MSRKRTKEKEEKKKKLEGIIYKTKSLPKATMLWAHMRWLAAEAELAVFGQSACQ